MKGYCLLIFCMLSCNKFFSSHIDHRSLDCREDKEARERV